MDEWKPAAAVVAIVTLVLGGAAMLEQDATDEPATQVDTRNGCVEESTALTLCLEQVFDQDGTRYTTWIIPPGPEEVDYYPHVQVDRKTVFGSWDAPLGPCARYTAELDGTALPVRLIHDGNVTWEGLPEVADVAQIRQCALEPICNNPMNAVQNGWLLCHENSHHLETEDELIEETWLLLKVGTGTPTIKIDGQSVQGQWDGPIEPCARYTATLQYEDILRPITMDIDGATVWSGEFGSGSGVPNYGVWCGRS